MSGPSLPRSLPPRLWETKINASCQDHFEAVKGTHNQTPPKLLISQKPKDLVAIQIMTGNVYKAVKRNRTHKK